jgi:GT2 family glycosyltransferase
MLNNKPGISVVICCYTLDRFKDTLDAIDSVKAQSLKPDEIIVTVDHNKNLFQRLKTELTPDVKLFLNDGAQGLNENRNVGIRAANGEIIAFLDDDATAEKDWLKNLTQPFADASVMAVGGKAIPAWINGKQPAWFPEELDYVIGCTAHKDVLLTSSNEIRNVTGSNMAFRKKAFNEAGLWPTNLGAVNGTSRGGEEAEMCMRIRSKFPGSKILYASTAVIKHKVNSARIKVMYSFGYFYRDGRSKANMKKIAKRHTSSPFAAEQSFLVRLSFKSVPSRLVRFYKPGYIQQAGVIIAGMILTGMGYVVGSLKPIEEVN